ncbi:MAG: PilZ domain-containing protein [bacterium]|jgi:hypothetical protein
MPDDRRSYEREQVRIPFIYSLDSGGTIFEGEWSEGVTWDIGPVLVGGMSFYNNHPVELNRTVRIVLFMDLNLLESWKEESEGFPAIYLGEICRVTPVDGRYHIAIRFTGLQNDPDESLLIDDLYRL